jgi:hypothetical protein
MFAAIVVEAAACLAAEPAGLDIFSGHGRYLESDSPSCSVHDRQAGIETVESASGSGPSALEDAS